MDDVVRDNLRTAGRIAAEARVKGVALCKEGASLLAIAEAIEAHMRSRGTPPAFPTCLSIDHIAAHYSPTHNDKLTLKRGNVVKLDLGAQVVEAGDTIAIEPFSTNGAGKVEGRKSGNIYRVLSTREIAPAALNEFLRRLDASFKGLPFAERWAYALDRKAPAHLGRLLRAGRIMTYEALLDAGRGIVAQTEHTMIVDDGGVEVTTR